MTLNYAPAVAHKPYRLLFKGPVQAFRMLHTYTHGGSHNFSTTQRAQRRDECLAWDRFSEELCDSVEVDTPDVPRLIRDNAIQVPSGCMTIAVQDFMGVCAAMPYSTKGHYHISETGQSAGRLDGIAALNDLYLANGLNVKRDTLWELCHGERYVRLMRGVMMLCPYRTRGILSAEQAFGVAVPSAPPTSPDVSVVAEMTRRRPVLSLNARVPNGA